MKNYYRELNNVQSKISHIDIITFTAFMDKDEKMAHLKYYADKVGYKINLG